MAERSTWTPLHAQLQRTLRERRLLNRDQRLLVAVSGGQDSLCLIKLLLDLQPKWGWEIAIAHCDHRWRADSQANADYVEHLAQLWGISCYRQTAAVGIKSEAEARQWRYQVLTETALEHHYQKIVTGHTASDRAETLLYNLIRGSGSDGLQALLWQRKLAANLQLIRPLLEITRSETAQFCRDFHLTVWQDSTNQNLQYARNRIRQELLPYLQTYFNPQAEQALAQTAELLRAEVEYLEATAQDVLQQVLVSLGSGESQPRQLKLNRLVLKSIPLAIQRRVIRQCLQQCLPCSPSFEQIEKLTALISAPNRSRTDPFPGGAIASVEGDWIVIS